MKRLSLYLFLILFTFQTPSQADDIRDFQIEGMSIGDSLLDYFSEEDILSSKRNYQKNKKFYVVYHPEYSELKDYDVIDFYLKTDDKKYKIYAINGITEFKSLEKCKKKKDEVVKEVSNLFKDLKLKKYTKKHEFDKSGRSKQIISVWFFNSADHIRVECTVWSKKIKTKHDFTDNMSIVIMKKEVEDWISGGYK
jgi:hypothetical protein